MMRPPTPMYYKVIPLLQSFDSRTNEDDDHAGNLQAFFSQKGHKKSNKKPFNALEKKGFSPPHAKPTNSSMQGPNQSHGKVTNRASISIICCQICKKPGHEANVCWWHYDQSENDENAHDALAALTIHDDVSAHEWIADTGASSHMTSNKGISFASISWA